MQENTIKTKSLYKIILFTLLVLIVCLFIYGLNLFNSTKETINTHIYQPLPSIHQLQSEQKVINHEAIHVLFIGINTKATNRGGAESLILLSLDPKNGSTTYINIPGHTRALMVGKEVEDKINRAYTYGGANMTVESVQHLLNIEVDYYIQLDLAGIADLIDGFGGLTVENELAIEVGNFDVSPGQLHLNGSKALRYVEMLYLYEGEEIDHADLQQQIFENIIQHATTSVTINKLKTIASFFHDNLKTNMDFEIMNQLTKHYTNVVENVTEYTIDGNETIIDEEYYFIIPDTEIEKIPK